jgi:predicted metal-dependent phosphoesterase TrpH
VALRICFVTPFAWSQPHDVNDHVAGAAAALRRAGHHVTVVAPSTRRRDLLAGRRALQAAESPDVLAVGPSIPVSRRSHMGVAVGVRTNLTVALRQGNFDVVHGVEPGLPSISYLALSEAETLTAATFLSPDRLGYPARESQRDRFRARVDALLATSPATARAAAERFPGEYELVPVGVDTSLFHPLQKERLIVVELETQSRLLTRAALRALDDAPDWEALLLHTKPLGFRPAIPTRLRGRVHVRAARSAEQRAAALCPAAILVPAEGGMPRLELEAASAGVAIADPPARAQQPELVTAAVARLIDDESERERRMAQGVERSAEGTFDRVAAELEAVYARVGGKRRRRQIEDPLSDRDWITVDLHMHTRWSHDCSIEPEDLIRHAESIGLGAIAVTDHNVFAGALETARLSRAHDLIVIPGEEVKTDGQGEVIGLFLRQEIPRGMSFGETIAAIREQDGVVYLPHPFDRMHAIPDPSTLHAHLADIDVLEVYNARLLRDSFNDEALRFARKYRLLQGGGSDAHVLQGLGTGAVRMRQFDGAEEFLRALRSAEVVRRPKSLAYLQSLKWVAQVRDRVGDRRASEA